MVSDPLDIDPYPRWNSEQSVGVYRVGFLSRYPLVVELLPL